MTFARRSSSDSTAPPQHLRLGRNAFEQPVYRLPAFRLAVATACGVCAGTFITGNLVIWTCLLIIAAVYYLKANDTKLSAWAIYVGVVSAVALRVAAAPTPVAKATQWDSIPDDWAPVVLRAKVDSYVEVRPNQFGTAGDGNAQALESIVDLQITRVRSGQSWSGFEGTVTATAQGDHRDLFIGDEVHVLGLWRRIPLPTNPGADNMRVVYADQQRFANLRVDLPEQLTKLDDGSPSVARLLSWISNHGDRVLRDMLGEPHGVIASAIVLGRRKAVPPATRDRLLETGTVHLLSVSGLHLAMVAGFTTALLLLTGWRRSTQILILILVCFFYAALTGARPPVLRASILVVAVSIGFLLGRQSSILNSLSIAAAMLLLIRPNLLFDTGTQLSFLAVTTLVFAGKHAFHSSSPQLDALEANTRSHLHNLLLRIRTWFWGTLKISGWMWLITAPLIWNTYNIISPVSILANALVIPLITVSLAAGLLTTVLGLWAPFAAALPASVCMAVLSIQQSLLAGLVDLPCSHIWLPSPPGWLVLAYYTIIGLSVCVSTSAASSAGQGALAVARKWHAFAHLQLSGSTKIAIVSALWFGVAFYFAFGVPRRQNDLTADTLHLTFIDMGHGASVLIELPNNAGTYLYDAGRLGDPRWSINPIEDVLWSKGIRELDAVLVSHADADHYNAIPMLLRRFQVNEVWTTNNFLQDDQPGLRIVFEEIERSKTNVRTFAAGDTLTDNAGATWGTVLHPPDHRVEGNDNANSLVLVMDYGGKPLVLPGDLELPGTDFVLSHERPDPGGLLMAPHHGSISQDPLALLQWARPDQVIVSGGRRAAQPAVKQHLSATGGNVYVTAELGAIQMSVSSDGTTHIDRWSVDRWIRLE